MRWAVPRQPVFLGPLGLARKDAVTTDADDRAARIDNNCALWQWRYPDGYYPLETAFDLRLQQIVQALGPGGVVR